eukprot:11982801-Alexandrium_andersonii.AAC.1
MQDAANRFDSNQLAKKSEYEAELKDLGGGSKPEAFGSELCDSSEGGHEDRNEKGVQDAHDQLDENQ